MSKSIDFLELLAELYYLEFLEISKDARMALLDGDKLKALQLAILAHKFQQKYFSVLDELLFL